MQVRLQRLPRPAGPRPASVTRVAGIPNEPGGQRGLAQDNCIVTVRRVRSMDLDEDVTGAELDQALVSLAAKTAAAMSAR